MYCNTPFTSVPGSCWTNIGLRNGSGASKYRRERAPVSVEGRTWDPFDRFEPATGLYEDRWDRISPHGIRYVRNMLWNGTALATHKWPSTGMVAIMFALHTCNTTRLYGFGPSRTSVCAKYYGKCAYLRTYLNDTFSQNWHDMRLEYTWLMLQTKNFTRNEIRCES